MCFLFKSFIFCNASFHLLSTLHIKYIYIYIKSAFRRNKLQFLFYVKFVNLSLINLKVMKHRALIKALCFNLIYLGFRSLNLLNN